METFNKTLKTIFAPRSLWVFLIQYLSIAPSATAIIIIIVFFTSNTSANFNDILIILFAFILPLFTAAFFMLYCPQKYIVLIIFDSEKNILSKVKRRNQVQTFDMTKARFIISKILKTNSISKYNLILNDIEDNLHIIFDENIPFGPGHWEDFSEKLSNIIGLPLKKEYWIEELNGKVSMISSEARDANRKRGLLISSIPFGITFLGAIGYKFFSTFKAFILFGLAMAFINICLSYIYLISHRNQIGPWGNNNFKLILYILTLSILYSFFYVFFVFTLDGFHLSW